MTTYPYDLTLDGKPIDLRSLSRRVLPGTIIRQNDVYVKNELKYPEARYLTDTLAVLCHLTKMTLPFVLTINFFPGTKRAGWDNLILKRRWSESPIDMSITRIGDQYGFIGPDKN